MKRILLISFIFLNISIQCMDEFIDFKMLDQEVSNSVEFAVRDHEEEVGKQNIFNKLMSKITKGKEAKVAKILKQLKAENGTLLELVINLFDQNTGHVPLTQAIETENPKIVEYLIDAKAKVNERVTEFVNSKTFSDEVIKLEIDELLLHAPKNDGRAPSLLRKLRAARKFEEEYRSTKADAKETKDSIPDSTPPMNLHLMFDIKIQS